MMPAEVLANRMLQNYWAEDGRIAFPVDPKAIAEKLNINVTDNFFLGSDISGLLFRHQGEQQISATINSSKPLTHQRFTLAHELGHYAQLEKAGLLNHPMGFVEKRDDLASKGTDPQEIFSNQFATALLMPAGAVRYFHHKDWALDKIADIFCVSKESMGYRLQNLRLLL